MWVVWSMAVMWNSTPNKVKMRHAHIVSSYNVEPEHHSLNARCLLEHALVALFQNYIDDVIEAAQRALHRKGKHTIESTLTSRTLA